MKTLVCLHGWGGSKESFTELREALEGTGLHILTPDLPGFGDEQEPSQPFTVGDYAKWVADYIEQNVEGEYILLGHSHGGRTSIKFMHNLKHDLYNITPPTHLFLCASAGIRHRRHFKRIVGLVLAKGGNFLLSIPPLRYAKPIAKKLLYKLVRVHDYEKASEVMRKTLILVSKEDLRPLLKEIDTPTDLFWGEDDGMTPYGDALTMKNEIPNVTLHSYEGVRHRVHRDKAKEIAEVIKKYI